MNVGPFKKTHKEYIATSNLSIERKGDKYNEHSTLLEYGFVPMVLVWFNCLYDIYMPTFADWCVSE